MPAVIALFNRLLKTLGLRREVGRLPATIKGDIKLKPEEHLRLFVSETEWEFARLRKEIPNHFAATEEFREQLEARLAEATRWREKARVILSKGVDDLAHEALRREREARLGAKQLYDQHRVHLADPQGLRAGFARAREKLAMAKRDYVKQSARAESTLPAWGAIDSESPETRAVWDRFYQKLGGKIEQLEKALKGDQILLADLSESEAAIEERVATLPTWNSTAEALAALKANPNAHAPRRDNRARRRV